MPTQGTPSPEQLHILLARARRDGLDATVIERLTVILHFVENRYSISETCRQFGISRSTFHRWIERFDPENLSTLADKSHEPLTVRQSSIDAESIELIRRYRMRYPQMGKERIAELLMLDHAVEISPSSVGRVIERECLYFADTPFHWKKRLEKQANVGRNASDIITEQKQNENISVPVIPETEHVTQHIVVESEEVDESDDTLSVIPVRGYTWQSIKRLVIVSSVITNVAFVSLLLGSALMERVSTPVHSDVAAESLHAAPAALYIP